MKNCVVSKLILGNNSQVHSRTRGNNSILEEIVQTRHPYKFITVFRIILTFNKQVIKSVNPSQYCFCFKGSLDCKLAPLDICLVRIFILYNRHLFVYMYGEVKRFWSSVISVTRNFSWCTTHYYRDHMKLNSPGILV